jgi:hypothetical protein
MLPADKLEFALTIHDRSYRLLKWVSEAIDKGFIPITRAHDYANEKVAALDWIESNYQNVPAAVRPPKEDLIPFANFFSTYLTSSFEFVAKPGMQRKSWDGCFCPWCSRMVAAPHLRPKSLTKRDKRRAGELMAERMITLGKEHGIEVASEQVEAFMNDEAKRRKAAYSTYGHWLIRRLDGQSEGPALLALWREMAWKRSGSPIQGFELRLKDFIQAEADLIKDLKH